MSLGEPVPVLRMFDERKAKEFFVEFLGFTVEWEHRFEEGFPLYMEIAKDDCTIHLSEHHGDCCPGAAIRIATSDLNALHEALNAKEYGFSRPSIVDTPWDSKEMSVEDPFGNRLTFIQSQGE